MAATKEIQSIRSLSALYSGSMFRKILNDGTLCAIEPRVRKHKGILTDNKKPVSLGLLLEALYELMTTSYCNEYIYKNSVLNELLKRYSLSSTTLLDEFKVGKSVADLVLINGETKVFELKTDLDTLSRLENQLNDYRKAIEKIYIVASQKYINYMLDKYSESDFGIIELRDGIDLHFHKEALPNKLYFEHEIIFKMLRKNEYSHILRDKFGYLPDVPNTLYYKECLELSCQIDVIEFQSLAFSKLKERKLRIPEIFTDSVIPKSLRFLCHTLDLEKGQYASFLNLLNQKI
jgi:hypothetical protein